jgi:hypothetical protein
MKVISTGSVYSIYPDDLRTHDKLPAQSYIVRFSDMTGFSLEKYSNIEIKEKIYGVHDQKLKKVMEAFNVCERNLGVILSGDKGIGKSLFAKMLAKSVIESGIPVIVVDKFYPSIASFLESIEQEVMVLFDEFDKTFGEVQQSENLATPQSSLLTLFDGISPGKKLYVITCNDIYSLNDFLINRPGRFHYHFRFGYPNADEVKEYLKDKIDEQYYGEIKKVVEFSKKVLLNYDCLRAIAFELNFGRKFENAIEDLNIMNMYTERYTITLHYENGYSLKSYVDMDLFGNDDISRTFRSNDGNEEQIVRVKFNTSDNHYDYEKHSIIINGDKIMTEYYDNDKSKEVSKMKLEYMSIKREKPDNYHYAV